MTISTQSNRADFTGNGSATNFPFNFKAFDAADIRVVRTNSSTGESVALTSPSDYAVALTPSGGSVTLASALAVGFRLSVIRIVLTTQTTAVPNQGPFPASNIEERFDRLAAAVQQLDERSSRSFRLSDGDVDPSTGLPSTSAVLQSKAFVGSGDRVLFVGESGLDVSSPFTLSAVEAVAGINDAIVAVAANEGNISAVAANEANVNAAADLLAVPAPGIVAKDSDGAPVARALEADDGLAWDNASGGAGNPKVRLVTENDAALIKLGGGALGRSLLKSADAPAARTLLGGGAVGQGVFGAGTQEQALTALELTPTGKALVRQSPPAASGYQIVNPDGTVALQPVEGAGLGDVVAAGDNHLRGTNRVGPARVIVGHPDPANPNTADTKAAIEAAAALVGVGGVIHVPAGVWATSAEIRPSHADQHFIFEGELRALAGCAHLFGARSAPGSPLSGITLDAPGLLNGAGISQGVVLGPGFRSNVLNLRDATWRGIAGDNVFSEPIRLGRTRIDWTTAGVAALKATNTLPLIVNLQATGDNDLNDIDLGDLLIDMAAWTARDLAEIAYPAFGVMALGAITGDPPTAGQTVTLASGATAEVVSWDGGLSRVTLTARVGNWLSAATQAITWPGGSSSVTSIVQCPGPNFICARGNTVNGWMRRNTGVVRIANAPEALIPADWNPANYGSNTPDFALGRRPTGLEWKPGVQGRTQDVSLTVFGRGLDLGDSRDRHDRYEVFGRWERATSYNSEGAGSARYVARGLTIDGSNSGKVLSPTNATDISVTDCDLTGPVDDAANDWSDGETCLATTGAARVDAGGTVFRAAHNNVKIWRLHANGSPVVTARGARFLANGKTGCSGILVYGGTVPLLDLSDAQADGVTLVEVAAGATITTLILPPSQNLLNGAVALVNNGTVTTTINQANQSLQVGASGSGNAEPTFGSVTLYKGTASLILRPTADTQSTRITFNNAAGNFAGNFIYDYSSHSYRWTNNLAGATVKMSLSSAGLLNTLAGYSVGDVSVVDVNRLLQTRAYTAATAPAGEGKLSRITDGGGGEGVFIMGDGTRARRVGDGPVTVIATDAAVTLAMLADGPFIRHTGTLTEGRAITLPTTGVYNGAEYHVTRTGGGAFNLSVGGLKNLAQNEWAAVKHDGTEWYLTAFGSL